MMLKFLWIYRQRWSNQEKKNRNKSLLKSLFWFLCTFSPLVAKSKVHVSWKLKGGGVRVHRGVLTLTKLSITFVWSINHRPRGNKNGRADFQVLNKYYNWTWRLKGSKYGFTTLINNSVSWKMIALCILHGKRSRNKWSGICVNIHCRSTAFAILLQRVATAHSPWRIQSSLSTLQKIFDEPSCMQDWLINGKAA